jgi:transcriptional regulator with XRE-family HTH domain
MEQVLEDLRRLRMQKGFSQEYMATKLDVDQKTYSNTENGKVELTLSRLSKICDILEIQVSDLFAKQDDRNITPKNRISILIELDDMDQSKLFKINVGNRFKELLQ